jgi:hypothetical protein
MSQTKAPEKKAPRTNDRPVDDRYYTSGEFAALCRCSRSNVYMKIAMGEVLGLLVMGRRLIPKKWAHEYLDRLEREQSEEMAVHEMPAKGRGHGW